MNILDFSAVQLSDKIRQGEISVREAVTAVFNQIEEKDKVYNCYVTTDRQSALRQADEVQKKIDAGEYRSPLAGVPVAMKDNICTSGILTTCSSKILSNFTPEYDAQAVVNLKQAGAVILGKTNMDEFAMGSTTETSYFGGTKNPWNTEYVSGGSSGGSAAAVAAKECFFALGSDTGGSIRQPASYCGVVGLKPTYSTVSRYGLIAYASSLDQIGPLSKNVTDAANILEVISSYDKKDSTSRKREYGFAEALKEDVRGMRIAIPKEYFSEGIDEEVKQAVLEAAKVLEDRGAIVEEISLKMTDYAIPAYYTIASAEASSNLERFDGIKYGYRTEEFAGLHNMYKKTRSEGFGSEVKRRIMLGSFVLSSGYYDAYYLKALKIKRLIKEEFNHIFETYDVILGPVAPSTAPKAGKSLCNPMEMYLSDVYTISANLAGLCGISVPCGFDSKGLPIGLQLMGNCFEEKKIIQAAYTYEQARGDFAVPADKVDIDTLKNDTLKNDTLKNDMLKNDILKNDMLKNDTLKNDTLKNDTWKEEKTDGEEEI